MSMLNHNGEDSSECPLCMELLEMDDLSFYPCTCLYQICRFCWHRIRTDENGLCPACRKQYPENPADFKPLSTQEMHRIKAEKRQKDQHKKQKATENRKHLANVRVVQRNLVFVVGLSPRLADPEVLKRQEYFGKFGKIHKVVINHSTQYAGSQGPSASAYVTYVRGEDALRAIQSVNNISVDSRTLRASLGTTKYCSHFMKNQSCPKPDCMYLHEIGDEAASFTKEEMQQGKHTDYERLLHEQLFICQNHKEGRKTSASPPLQGASAGAQQGGSREAWPSLPPGNTTGNSSSAASLNNTSGKVAATPANNSKSETTTSKEKSLRSKGKSQTLAAGSTGQSDEAAAKTNGSTRKIKEKTTSGNGSAITGNGSGTAGHSQQERATLKQQERQRSTSRSPALSSSSNPTPPPTSTSPTPPPTSQESGFPSTVQQHHSILQQGASLAAEEEEIDRARDEAEDIACSAEVLTPAPVPVAASSSYGHTHSILDNGSNNHSFFSTGPLPAYTARTTGTSASACWLANGAEEGSVKSSLPNQSASDWQSAFTDLTACSQLVPNLGVDAPNLQFKSSDDDLGFDPFHETQKALAEMLEKESISNGSSYSNNYNQACYPGHGQSLYSNPSVPSPLVRQNSNFSLGLGLGLGVGIAPTQQQPSRTRVPPPGFNPSQMTGSTSQRDFGLSLPNLGSNRPAGRMDIGASKMLPFMNHHSVSNGNSSSSIAPRLFNESPSMGLGMSSLGVGLSGNVGMGVNNMTYMAAQNGSLNQMSVSKSQQGFGMGLGSNLSYGSNGSGSSSGLVGNSMMGDPTPCMKDWQDGLRALFPNVNISMGNGAGVMSNSNSNSRMGAFPPGISGLGNGQHQMQQHHHHQQQQQQQQSNSMASKGWRSSVPDWTALDPAIVSSGQITDSRSDSPPHWLRSLEQLTESSPAQHQQHHIHHHHQHHQQQQQPPPPLPGNPSNLFGLSTNSSHYSLPSLPSRSNLTTAGLDASGLSSMGSFWPPSMSHSTPSMPPPGFSHIIPSSKTSSSADAQKIDNL